MLRTTRTRRAGNSHANVKVGRMDEWLTTKEAGEVLGVSDSRVRQFILKGRLRAKKRGKQNFIYRPDLDRLAEDLTNKPPTRPGPVANVAKKQQPDLPHPETEE